MLLLRSSVLILVFLSGVIAYADAPLTIDAGLLDETQVHEVWWSIASDWKNGREAEALSRAKELVRARAESGWPLLLTASVQAESFSDLCLRSQKRECAQQWADISVGLAPVSGRAHRHRAWVTYQTGGDFSQLLQDMRMSWELDYKSTSSQKVTLTRLAWLGTRGSWGFLLMITLCFALKLLRSLSLVWRRWLPWLTGRSQILASFTVVVAPWIFGAPLLVWVAWIWVLAALCERRTTQVAVLACYLLGGALLLVEPLLYQTIETSSYSQRWAERLRQTPERRFDLPITDLDTTTFRLSWSGQREKAKSLLEEGARLGELGPESWTLLGMLRADSAGLTSSIDAFEEAISADPEALEARFNKQRAHFALAQHQEAMTSYGVLKSLAPELCALWSDSAFERPPHGFVYPELTLANLKSIKPLTGPTWRADDVASGAIQTFLGVSRSQGIRVCLAGGLIALALFFLRRQIVSSRSCSDCGYMVEWSQLMWRPMLCARCLPYKLSGRQRTMWTWQHFKGVRRERVRLNFGRILGLIFPGFDHAWLGNPLIAMALMLPAAISWVALAGSLTWVSVPSVYLEAMTGLELIPASLVLAAIYLVSSFLRLQREQ